MKLLEKNMAVLWALAPETARWINRSSPDPEWEFISSDEHGDNLILPGPGEGGCLLYEPDQSDDNNLKPLGRPSAPTTVLVGLGLGKRLAGLLNRAQPGKRFLVVEENPALVKAALERNDFSSRLASGAVIFIPALGQALEKFGASMLKAVYSGESFLLVDEGCRRFFSEQFKQTVESWERSAGMLDIKARALSLGAAKQAANEMINLPLSLLSPDISNLKGALAGTPALVTSAGPSLEGALPLLARASGRTAVIAAAPVLRVLKAHGILPDLIGILDYGTSNYDVLLDAFASNVLLAFLEGTFPQVIKDYQGELISVLHDQGSTFAWLGPHLGRRDPRPSGTNVGSFCLNLAIYLGADPIILVGQDLSFPEPASHSEGVVGRKRMRAATGDPQVIMLPSVTGGLVGSNLTLASFLEEFNETIKKHAGLVINTSPGGARIAGTREMSLEEALEKYVGDGAYGKPVLKDFLKPTGVDYSAVTELIKKHAGELAAIARLAGQAEELARHASEVAPRVGSPSDDKWQKLVQAQMKATAGVEGYIKSFPPLKNYLAGMSLNAQAPVKDKDWRKNAVEFFKARAEKTSAYKQGAAALAKALNQSGPGLAGGLYAIEIEGKNDPLVPELMDAAGKFKSLGRMGRALALYQKALELDPQNPDAAVAATETALSLERLDLARDIIDVFQADEKDKGRIGLVDQKIETLHKAWLEKAGERLEQGDLVTAVLLAEKKLNFRPDDPEALELFGDCRGMLEKRLNQARLRDRDYYRRKQSEQAGSAPGPASGADDKGC